MKAQRRPCCARCGGSVLWDADRLMCLACGQEMGAPIRPLPRVPSTALRVETADRVQRESTYLCVDCGRRYPVRLLRRVAAHSGPYHCRAECPALVGEVA